jgi:hypothetical protein
MISGRLLFLLAALAACVTALAQARAAPLDAEACTKLQTEHGELENAGVEKDMEKGPDWAKANLGLEKLQRVQRFIELEELLLFRCRSRTIVHLTPEREWSADQDNDDKDDKDDNDDKDAAPRTGKAGAASAKAADPKQKPDAGRKTDAQPAAKPKKQNPGAQPAKTTPAKAAAGQPTESGVTSIEKRPPPKAKVDDALKVQPPDPSVDPFAHQLKPPAK